MHQPSLVWTAAVVLWRKWGSLKEGRAWGSGTGPGISRYSLSSRPLRRGRQTGADACFTHFNLSSRAGLGPGKGQGCGLHLPPLHPSSSPPAAPSLLPPFPFFSISPPLPPPFLIDPLYKGSKTPWKIHSFHTQIDVVHSLDWQ